MQISGELNQSLSWPRSSVICSAPTARLSVAKPKKSKGAFFIVDFGRVAQRPEEGDDADRHVDVKHPAPVVVVGEPAAERRPHDRTDGDARHPDAHRLGELLARIDVEHHRLRHGHECGAARALQQPRKHHLRQGLGDTAKHRRQSEARDRDQDDALAAESAGEPPGHRRHDGRGHDVGSQHPGHLILSGRERALNARQRDVGDRVVENLHDRGRHEGHRDERPAPALYRGAHCVDPGVSAANERLGSAEERIGL